MFYFDYHLGTGIGCGVGRSGSPRDPRIERVEIDADTYAMVAQEPHRFRWDTERGIIMRREDAPLPDVPAPPFAPSEMDRVRTEIERHGTILMETNFWLRRLIEELKTRTVAGALFLLCLLAPYSASAACTKSAGTATTTDGVIGDTVAHSTRCSFLVQNQSSSNDVYAEFGAAAAANTSMDIPPSGYWAMDVCANPEARTFLSPLHVITSTGTAPVVFTECLF